MTPEIEAPIAPEGQFRVMGWDTFSDEHFFSADLPSVEDAKNHVNEKLRECPKMLMLYTYNDKGICLAVDGSA